MSIIERYSPLNLAYKVIVVTNASSPAGVIVCNTLLKSNALVLGVDDKPKEDSLTTSTFTHFQFHQCKLADESSVADVIADAKKKFKVDRVDGLVNLANADDDSKTREGHTKLAAACAENMKDGGAIAETLLQAASADAQPSKETDQLTSAAGDISSKVSSQKVRCNVVAPSDKQDPKACPQFEEAKKHLEFLFKPSHNPNLVTKSQETSSSKEKQRIFEFSNVVLFLISGMSEGLNGAVLSPRGQLIKS